MIYFDQIMLPYYVQYCQGTSMQNGDEASPSIGQFVRGQLVNIFITLEPHGMF